MPSTRMGIGTTLAGRVEKELMELPKKTDSQRSLKSGNSGSSNPTTSRSNSKKHKKKNKKPAVSPVQKLLDTCKDVFANNGSGIVPSVGKIERLRSVLDGIKPEDVGLSTQMSYFRPTSAGRTPVITYLHIYECKQFSMAIFCLPPSAVIPLHNHPGMTVFSKLLFGRMHIKSYDWVDNPPVSHPEVRLAKIKVNANFTAPCNASILYPTDGGNMHCFTAREACAVLDIFGPPYARSEGRHCTYYLDYPFAHFSGEECPVPEDERGSYAWLKERGEKAEELNLAGQLYNILEK